MKEKIIILIIGILIGATVSTGILYALSLTNTTVTNCTPEVFEKGNRGDFKRPDGDMGNPPEKPDGEPPEMNQGGQSEENN